MKNKINLAKITCFILLLTATAIILVIGTNKKYSNNASDTDSTVIAKWSFIVNNDNITILGSNEEISFDLFQTINDTKAGNVKTDVAEGLIAPGSTGSFEFALQNSSEVSTKYTINLEVDNKNIPLQFSIDGGENWTDVTNLSDLVVTDVMAIDSKKHVTVQWKWAFDGDTDATLNGETVKVTAHITATKVDNANLPTIEYAVFPNITQQFNETMISSTTSVMANLSPFTYQNLDLLSGKTLTKIGIPVKSVSAINDNQTFTLHVVKKEPLKNLSATTILRSYKLKLPKSQLGSSTTVNKWIYVDLTNYNITIGDNEILAFASATDTVTWGYSKNNISSNYRFYREITSSNIAATTDETNILFDIYYKEKSSNDIPSLASVLEGKNFSILGDSISTYTGYSNDAVNTNDTIGNNQIWYTGLKGNLTDVNQTWWMQVVSETKMNLLVNNSSSGAKVIGTGNVSGTTDDQGIGIRPQNLHDNTGENADTNPDVIAVYMGINDLNANKISGSYETINFNTLIVDNNDGTYTYGEPTTFADGYAIMLHKIKTAYPNADIFVMNMPLRSSSASDILTSYNDIIEKLANYFEMNLVDLYSSEISGINYANNSSDGLHPNQTGMDLMTETFIDALEAKYLNN